MTHTLLARAWETLLVMMRGDKRRSYVHQYTHAHTLTHIHTADLHTAGTVRSTDSWMTLCGPLAVCKGGEVSGQTTVAVQEANQRANTELTVYIKNSTTLSMLNESFTNASERCKPIIKPTFGLARLWKIHLTGDYSPPVCVAL